MWVVGVVLGEDAHLNDGPVAWDLRDGQGEVHRSAEAVLGRGELKDDAEGMFFGAAGQLPIGTDSPTPELRDLGLAPPAPLTKGTAAPDMATERAAHRTSAPTRHAGTSDPPLAASTGPVRAGTLTVDPIPVRRRRGTRA